MSTDEEAIRDTLKGAKLLRDLAARLKGEYNAAFEAAGFIHALFGRDSATAHPMQMSCSRVLASIMADLVQAEMRLKTEAEGLEMLADAMRRPPG